MKAVLQKGFTLIELLVALVIAGLLIGVVALSLGVGNSSKSVLATAVDQLHQLTALGREQAIWSSQPMGLLLLPPEMKQPWRYQWLRFQGGEWLQTDEPTAAVSIEAGVVPQVMVEGEAVDHEQLQLAATKHRPLVVFYPTGEVSTFEVSFVMAERQQ